MARYWENLTKLVDTVLSGPGKTTSELRCAVEAQAGALSGRQGTDATVPDDLSGWVEKVALHAYQTTDEDIELLKAAGYSELRAGRTGHELLQRADVAALVRELDAEKRAESGIDEPWIVDRLVEIVERSMTGVPRTSALGEFLPDPVTGLPMMTLEATMTPIQESVTRIVFLKSSVPV